jgi:hypothetical protein
MAKAKASFAKEIGNEFFFVYLPTKLPDDD